MRKFILSLALIFSGLSSYACMTDAFIGFDNGCFTRNADGTETITISLNDLCAWSNVPSPTWSINIWIQKTATLSTNMSDYAIYNIMPTDPTFGGGHYTFTFTISAADAMPADSCFTFYAIAEPSDRPWNESAWHQFYPAITLCPCLDPAKACYYSQASGENYLKFVSSSPVANTNIVMWQIYPSGTINSMYDGSALVGIIPDDDGTDYDYLYDVTYTNLGWSLADSADKCDTFLFGNYYDPTYGTPPYGYGGNNNYSGVIGAYQTTPAKICPCPLTPSDGCYAEFDSAGNSYARIKLLFSNTIYTINGSSMYIWLPGGTTPYGPTSVSADINGLDYDYYYTIPWPGHGDFDKNGCFQIYCYNNTSKIGDAEDVNGADFGTLATICPCCSHYFNYTTFNLDGLTISFQGPTNGVWHFGDGSPAVHAANTLHTYASTGTYVATFTGTDIDGSPCVMRDTICVAENPKLKPLELAPCAFIDVTMDGGTGVSVRNGTITIPGFIGDTYQESFDWGDGGSTGWLATNTDYSHYYSTAGSYKICMTVQILDENWQVVSECTTCINICIASDTHYGFRAGNNKLTEALSDQVELAPNPASNISTLSFSLQKDAPVTVMLIDMTGRVVNTVINNSPMTTGMHKIDIPTSNLPSGLYILNIQSNGVIRTRKLSVIR